MIQAALNGARVPMGPERLAAEAAAVAALGCRSIHLHVHDGDGRESLAAPHVAAAVAAVRVAAPGAEIGVSTGEWIAADVAGAIAAWTDPLPDMASANLAEPACADVIGALRARGVAIEAGIFSPADADALVRAG
ncbi:MAG: 3-keto-5-aminohexanoate cleavage protein, partial [Solirubrobacteraceae bacterium]